LTLQNERLVSRNGVEKILYPPREPLGIVQPVPICD
jgi:hypothetical protein